MELRGQKVTVMGLGRFGGQSRIDQPFFKLGIGLLGQSHESFIGRG